MATQNFYEVSSPDHFKELLSQDLERVSLISFWASWAEPCEKMNEVVLALARKYTHVLVLQVEAEVQPEISESFDIDSVPTCLILRGHALLDRISGVDAVGLTKCIEKHAGSKPFVSPLSKTTQAPAPPAPIATIDENPEVSKDLEDRLRTLMNQNKVVLFMKGSPDTPRCGFSRKTVALLREQGVEFSHFDILSDEDVRQGLKVLNNWPTFPQIIINGELIGGLDILQEMVDSGEFKELGV